MSEKNWQLILNEQKENYYDEPFYWKTKSNQIQHQQ